MSALAFYFASLLALPAGPGDAAASVSDSVVLYAEVRDLPQLRAKLSRQPSWDGGLLEAAAKSDAVQRELVGRLTSFSPFALDGLLLPRPGARRFTFILLERKSLRASLRALAIVDYDSFGSAEGLLGDLWEASETIGESQVYRFPNRPPVYLAVQKQRSVHSNDLDLLRDFLSDDEPPNPLSNNKEFRAARERYRDKPLWFFHPGGKDGIGRVAGGSEWGEDGQEFPLALTVNLGPDRQADVANTGSSSDTNASEDRARLGPRALRMLRWLPRSTGYAVALGVANQLLQRDSVSDSEALEKLAAHFSPQRRSARPGRPGVARGRFAVDLVTPYVARIRLLRSLVDDLHLEDAVRDPNSVFLFAEPTPEDGRYVFVLSVTDRALLRPLTDRAATALRDQTYRARHGEPSLALESNLEALEDYKRRREAANIKIVDETYRRIRLLRPESEWGPGIAIVGGSLLASNQQSLLKLAIDARLDKASLGTTSQVPLEATRSPDLGLYDPRFFPKAILHALLGDLYAQPTVPSVPGFPQVGAGIPRPSPPPFGGWNLRFLEQLVSEDLAIVVCSSVEQGKLSLRCNLSPFWILAALELTVYIREVKSQCLQNLGAIGKALRGHREVTQKFPRSLDDLELEPGTLRCPLDVRADEQRSYLYQYIDDLDGAPGDPLVAWCSRQLHERNYVVASGGICSSNPLGFDRTLADLKRWLGPEKFNPEGRKQERARSRYGRRRRTRR